MPAIDNDGLFSVTGLDVTANGNTATIDMKGFRSGFMAIFETTSFTGTVPTCDPVVEHSHDGTIWKAFNTGGGGQDGDLGQLTNEGALVHQILGPTMRYVRFSWAKGGTVLTGVASAFIQAGR